MARLSSSAATALLAACLGCATTPGRAERIGTRPDGGSIMLSANNDKAWESAKEMMSSHCDGHYRVVSQMTETAAARGGPPPATPSAMADPVGPAGAAYGIRVDYECTGGPGPLPVPRPAGAPDTTPPRGPSSVPQTQTPIGR
jgi:hypothetical protein